MGTRAAVYARISSDDEGDALGVRRQREDCLALIEHKGWGVAGVFEDNDISAADKRKRRPGFEQLLAAIGAGELDAIVAWDLDRLVRRPVELEHFVERCQAARIRHLATVGGDVDLGTGDGLLVARIKGAVSADEIDKIRKRVRRKKVELAQAGKPSGGGSRPFGFEPDKLTVRESEADLIREAAHRVLAGDALGAICADWTERGVTTVTGRPWLPNVLRGILIAPRVAGLRQHQGAVVGEAAWPAILDRSTWERVRSVFLAPQRRRQAASRHLLTGLLVCGRCGARLLSGQNNGARAYVCRKGHGKNGCAGLAMVAEPLEAVVVEAVLKLADGPELVNALATREHQHEDDDAAGEVARLERKLRELAEAWAADEIDRASWLTARTAVEDRLEAARGRLVRQSRTEALDPFLGRSGALRAAWPELGVDRRRAVLATLIDRIVIGPARRGFNKFDGSRIEIDWRF